LSINFDYNLLYGIIAASTFSISGVIIKDLHQLGSPTLLNLYRAGIGAILFLVHLLVIQLVDEALELPLEIIFYLILSVIFNVVLGDTLFFTSQSIIGVKVATPIVNTFPLFTILIAVIFLDETMTFEFLLAGVIIIAGVAILSMDVDEEINSDVTKSNKMKGLIFAFICIFCYALGVIYTTLGAEGLNPIVANSIRLPAGTLLVSSIFIGKKYAAQSEKFEDEEIILENIEPINKKKAWFKMIIAGILGTYFASLFLVLSVQKVGAGKTAVLTSIGPLIVLPLAVFWLKEKVGKLTLIGTLMTLAGLWIILT
jgi:drug/metabolite transporter (DMT)-like permease